MLKKMLGLGGRTWFKIRPVQTGGINQRRLGKQRFSNVFSCNGPQKVLEEDKIIGFQPLTLALFSLFLKLTLDSKREDKESTLAEENIQQIKTLCRLIIFVRNSWMIQKALFQYFFYRQSLWSVKNLRESFEKFQ